MTELAFNFSAEFSKSLLVAGGDKKWIVAKTVFAARRF